MDKETVQTAENQITSVPKNTPQNARICSIKNEKVAEWICKDGELLQHYQATDLELTYVHDSCKILKVLKSLDINDQQVKLWYTEFLRMGWKRKDFDKQFEGVKRKKLFGRIDLADWLDCEIMYNEYDLNAEVDRRINRMIFRGKMLRQQILEMELTEEEKKFCRMEISQQLEFQFTNRRYELMEEFKIDLRKKYLDQLSGKKKKLAAMSPDQKMQIVDRLYSDGTLKGKPHDFEYLAVLHNLEDYADLIKFEI